MSDSRSDAIELRYQAQKLAEQVVSALREHELSLSLAESCTGGLIAALITDVPGASEVFIESAVTYSNEAKVRRLGVDPETLAQNGAVSDSCVREMVQGSVMESRADLAVAVSGIAGPDGGTEEKPVGTVYLAMAHAGKITGRRYRFDGDRKEIRLKTVIEAFEMIIDAIQKGV